MNAFVSLLKCLLSTFENVTYFLSNTEVLDASR